MEAYNVDLHLAKVEAISHVLIYEHVVNFLLGYMEYLPKEQAIETKRELEKEKQDFISNLFEEYSRIITAFSMNKCSDNKWGDGCFESELQRPFSSLINKPSLFVGKYVQKVIIIGLIKRLIDSEYLPPLNCHEIEFDLFALWVLFVAIPKTMPDLDLSPILKRLELTLIKLIAQASRFIAEMKYKWKYDDHEFFRIENIGKQKGKDEKRVRIFNAYEIIQINGKSRHKVATEIWSKLNEPSPQGKIDPISIDTIKRRLKEADLPPFD